MAMQMKMSDQACVHQSQIHLQSLRIEVVEPAAQKTKRYTVRNEQNKKRSCAAEYVKMSKCQSKRVMMLRHSSQSPKRKNYCNHLAPM